MRAPKRASTSVSQGLTRKTYQTAYGLGQKGSSVPGGTIKSEPAASTREYSKGKTTKMVADGKWNIDYGDTIPNGQLKDLLK